MPLKMLAGRARCIQACILQLVFSSRLRYRQTRGFHLSPYLSVRFIRFIKASILSLFCAVANPHHAEDGYMALDRVVAWATRWRESSGNPFDRSVLRAYNDDEAVVH